MVAAAGAPAADAEARAGRRRAWPVLVLLLAPALAMGADNDVRQANGYDAAWQEHWIAHCRSVLTSSGKSPGFVLQVGDSITHANPYGQWPRAGTGASADDAATLSWMQARTPFSGSAGDTSSSNGWYLAAADTSRQRGLTASSGLRAVGFLSGSGNGGAAMPALRDPAAAARCLADGATYPGNLNATTVAAAFSRAQVAVVMLGTNDARGGTDVATFAHALAGVVDAFEAQHIVVILSTIPPNPDPGIDARVAAYDQAITALASGHGLPLIDFHAEILARAPGVSWNGTLLARDDPHPSAGVDGYRANSDPYAAGGDAATGRTGAACAHSGYLLRSWLTIQKLTQLRSVLSGPPPAPAAH